MTTGIFRLLARMTEAASAEDRTLLDLGEQWRRAAREVDAYGTEHVPPHDREEAVRRHVERLKRCRAIEGIVADMDAQSCRGLLVKLEMLAWCIEKSYSAETPRREWETKDRLALGMLFDLGLMMGIKP